jgi:hypothetical protein
VTELRIGDQLIRLDREATTSAYSQIKESMTDWCGCVECRNFATQRDTLFTQGFKAFLADLGIDYRKEADVSPVGVIQDGSMPYSESNWRPSTRRASSKIIHLWTATRGRVLQSVLCS